MMSMEAQIKGLVALWDLISLGYDLNLKYVNTGIITGDDESAVVNLTSIVETAKRWNEPIQLFGFEDAVVITENEVKYNASVLDAAKVVNEYMEEPAGYKRGIHIPLVKLIGDRLLQVHSGEQDDPDVSKRVVLILDESK